MAAVEVGRKLKLDLPKGSAIFSNLRPTSTDEQVYETAYKFQKIYGETLQAVILTIETELGEQA